MEIKEQSIKPIPKMEEAKLQDKTCKKKKIERKDLLVLSYLRQNAREQLTKISKKTSIPVSTICDRLRTHEGGLIKKHVSLLDYKQLGYSMMAHIVMKCCKESRDEVKSYLMKNQNVNSFFRINNGFDFLVEGIFKDITHMETFLDELQGKGVTEIKVHYIIDEMKREEFMTNPDFAYSMMQTCND